MKIVLLGYMASGKSVVGEKLAQTLKLDYIDLDSFIETNEGMSISEIFSEKGEIYFRIREGEYLQILLNTVNNTVISIGGGTSCYGKNIEFIKEQSLSFYLKASISTIFNRVKKEISKRPLIANFTDPELLKEYIAKHLFERNTYYQKADFTVIVDKKTIDEICLEIKEHIPN